RQELLRRNLKRPGDFFRIWTTSFSRALTPAYRPSRVRRIFHIGIVDKVEIVDKMKSGRMG
ncbi:MAG: hypothetical protein M3Q54_07945, partial [Actinomycetota bacterium]|nr:hypothetical protein [Actinomycetota bacterium]